MKLALVLAAFLCVTWGTPFKCSSGFEIDNEQRDSTTVDQATCCIEKAPVVNCMVAETDQTPFDCEEGTMMKEVMGASYMRENAVERSQSSCCYTPTCYTPAYECPSGKSPIAWSPDNDPASTAPSEANCCEDTPAFVADCLHITAEPVYNAMGTDIHPFDCREGTTLNWTAAEVTSPDQAKCCAPYNATCARASGSEFEPTPFACSAGLKFDDIKSRLQSRELLPANDANCCSPYTKSCAQINDAGDVYQCPEGKANIMPDPSDKEPSDANCCQAITCGHGRNTCADITALLEGSLEICPGEYSYFADPAAASKVISLSQDLSLHMRLCCKRAASSADTPGPAPSADTFSGASSLQAGVVAVFAVAGPLLLLL